MLVSDFSVGQRVGTKPHTQAFQRNDRYGTVVTVGRKWVHARMTSGRVRQFAPDDLFILPLQQPRAMRSHRKHSHAEPFRPNHKSRMAQRNGAARYNTGMAS